MPKLMLRAVRLGVLLSGVLATSLLSGCALRTIKYEGKRLPVYQVENIIESKLQLQNPDKDIDVDITVDSDIPSHRKHKAHMNKQKRK